MNKLFDTKEEAVADFTKYAIPLTDDTNKEHAAVLMKKGGRYYYTKIEKGFHSTVWPTAVKYMPYKGEKYFLHTHPNYGRMDAKGKPRDNTPFSGVPGSRRIKDLGDATVVDYMGYDGIYLVSAMGNAYLYEGVGVQKPKNNTYANNKRELNGLQPIMTSLAKSKFCYKQLKSKKHKSKKYIKQPWTHL